MDYIFSQNQDVFQKKNVSIPHLRIYDETVSEQEEMMCDDFFRRVLFTVPGATVWNLNKRITNKSKMQVKYMISSYLYI